MAFEWNEDKRQANLNKHGVDFVDAARIFLGPTFEFADDREDYGEVRVRAIGRWNRDWFVVVYAWRSGNRRIISAWKAGRHDREAYDNRIRG